MNRNVGMVAPEFFGKIPIRQDITVLPADSKNKLIGWTCKEFQGCEVFKPYKDWVRKFRKKLFKDGFCGDLIEERAVRGLKELKVGDKIIVSNFFGFEEVTVIEIDYKTKEGLAESIGSLYPLSFSKDDRNAWVNDSMINKKCLDPSCKTKISK